MLSELAAHMQEFFVRYTHARLLNNEISKEIEISNEIEADDEDQPVLAAFALRSGGLKDGLRRRRAAPNDAAPKPEPARPEEGDTSGMTQGVATLFVRFRVRWFTRSCAAVVTLCLGLLVMLSASVETSHSSAGTPPSSHLTALQSGVLLSCAGVRLVVRRWNDERLAFLTFSWFACVAVSLGATATRASQWAAPTAPQSAGTLAGIWGLFIIVTVGWRLSIATTPRLLATAVTALSLTSLSRLELNHRSEAVLLAEHKNEAVLLFASLLLSELLGHTLEETLWHLETEVHHVSALVQQTAQQHSTVLRMLFPQGSAVAAGVLRDLVPPEACAAGIPFDEVTKLEECMLLQQLLC